MPDCETYEVTVVMAVYRGIDTLPVTLASIMQQEDVCFEVVLIDDGNTPVDREALISIAAPYPNVRVIHNSANRGLTKSLIAGCEAASAPFIARIDNGDLMLPNTRLRQQADLLRAHPEVGIVGGETEFLDLINGGRYCSKFGRRHYPCGETDSGAMLFIHVTVMFRQSTYQTAGGYDAQLRVGQDTDLWPRMLRVAEGVVEPIVYAVAPMGPNSISVKENNTQIWGKISRIWHEEHNGGNLIKRVFFKTSRVIPEFLKLLLPAGVRVRMRYQKHMNYLGAIAPEVRKSLSNIAAFYAIKTEK
ncbi:glycosyltransferase [Aureliella helgolandensis]|uniref:Glycosyltransferase EpsE n=1 Tax=Aureliella helgolandensis TaxID=2527968 RepID=A0A518GBZ2_9BACT|nr:glycosyltransferase [Aureliella helgolandensis]QDV26132.1 Putative glycosyltransferase EpsE [Aureliella helgolandensis]